MKFFVYLAFSILFVGCVSNDKVDNTRAAASVENLNGIYLFIRSKPIMKYDILGSIEFSWYDKLVKLYPPNIHSTLDEIKGILNFDSNVTNIVSQVKLKYPMADGIIFNDDISVCQVIRFK